MKEIRLTVRISSHDLMVKINTIKRLLSKGSRIKVSVKFKGREITHPELGHKVINNILNEIVGYSKIVNIPSQIGNSLYTVIDPK